MNMVIDHITSHKFSIPFYTIVERWKPTIFLFLHIDLGFLYGNLPYTCSKRHLQAIMIMYKFIVELQNLYKKLKTLIKGF